MWGTTGSGIWLILYELMKIVRTCTVESDDQTPVPPARATRGRGWPRGAARAPARAATEEPLVASIQARSWASTSEEEQLRLERFKKYHPPTLSGLASEDAHGFLEECHRFLHTMGIVEMSGVAFTTFQLKGVAYQRWWAYEVGSPAKVASLIWNRFLEFFLRGFDNQTLRDAWRMEFERLRQGTISVSEYVVRFSYLSRHAPALVAIVRERVRRFIEGLN
ncbi:uncharacterized protein [Nicotiana tomentosiformis]|uniref:uncharacterized protein n=1 Tax=Nicotiana tomentosiformis TaxID=4098 RepID=UPI00388C4C15